MVAEATGYPSEFLELDADMEGEHGEVIPEDGMEDEDAAADAAMDAITAAADAAMEDDEEEPPNPSR